LQQEKAPRKKNSNGRGQTMPSARTMRQIPTSLLSLLWLVLASPSLFAQAPPSADTFVSSSFAKTNFGMGTSLVVQNGSISLVQFNLSGIPSSSTVTKATLRLYVDAVTNSGKFDVYQVTSSWNESTVTYNTRPVVGNSASQNGPFSITKASMNQFFLVDITPLVQSWLSGATPNYGIALALTKSSAGSFSFDSKESLLTANGPELEIALAGAVGPQGPEGAQGPQGLTGATGPQGPAGVAGPKGDTGATGAQGAVGQTGPQGTQGLPGPIGLTGAQGPPGDPGPAGAQGLAGQGFNFRAAFDGSATYAPYDVVSYNGSSYNAKTATNPGDPTPDVNPNWSLMAQQGATGATGPSGPIGLTGATGATGAAGAQGPQGIPGPTGSTGAQGPQGPQGAAGSGFNWRGAFDCSASYSAGDAISYQGSSWITNTPIGGCVQPPFSPWSLLAQQGAAGPAGAQGAVGPQGIQGLMGFQGPQGPPGVAPPNTAVTNASNTFAASQTVNGNLILGAGGAVQFADGTTQNTASAGGSGVPSGFMILGTSPIPPAGYTSAGVIQSGSNSWSSMAPMPTARELLAAATVNGKIYAIGGQSGSGSSSYLNTVEVYDPSANTWSTGAPMPTARSGLAAAAGNGVIYAIGGSGSRAYFNTVEVYNPSSNSWSTAPHMPTARQALAAAAVNGYIYAIGGLNSSILNTVEVYNPDPHVNAWSTPPPLPTARYALTADVVNGKIYAIGGGGSAGYLNVVEVYDPSGNAWSTATPLQTARKSLAATDNNGLVYAIGGFLDSYLNTVEQYSPAVTLYTFLKN
jgi:hypothetical protein